MVFWWGHAPRGSDAVIPVRIQGEKASMTI